MKVRLPAPKAAQPALGAPVVFAAGPGKSYVGKLVGFAWQEDRDPPPGQTGEWAWLEVNIEFAAEVKIEIREVTEGELDLSLPSTQPPAKDRLN